MTREMDELVEGVLNGKHRSLARLITHIENRRDGYREAIKQLHEHTGDAHIIGVTGSPGAGKSTLVDKMVKKYRDEGKTVGIIAVDPASPFTGGSILGDRIRLKSTSGDMDVFFRSMSARGALGGLSAATGDAIKALDAFGKDVIIVETVGAGQNEVDVVKTADTVMVLLMPSSGDDIQMLKAGILEIGDLFVVNKADLEGADRTVMEVEHMLAMKDSGNMTIGGGSAKQTAGGHGPGHGRGHGGGRGAGSHQGGSSAQAEKSGEDEESDEEDEWEAKVVKTVAERGEGVEDVLSMLANHHEFLIDTGKMREKELDRYSGEIRTLLQNEFREIAEDEIEEAGGLEALAEEIVERESDPYTTVEEILQPLEDCIEET